MSVKNNDGGSDVPPRKLTKEEDRRLTRLREINKKRQGEFQEAIDNERTRVASVNKGSVPEFMRVPVSRDGRISQRGYYVQPSRVGKKAKTIYLEPELADTLDAMAEVSGMDTQAYIVDVLEKDAKEFRGNPKRIEQLTAKRLKDLHLLISPQKK